MILVARTAQVERVLLAPIRARQGETELGAQIVILVLGSVVVESNFETFRRKHPQEGVSPTAATATATVTITITVTITAVNAVCGGMHALSPAQLHGTRRIVQQRGVGPVAARALRRRVEGRTLHQPHCRCRCRHPYPYPGWAHEETQQQEEEHQCPGSCGGYSLHDIPLNNSERVVDE
jgi:hypothetical protein